MSLAARMLQATANTHEAPKAVIDTSFFKKSLEAAISICITGIAARDS
jgi:hypothetical protein